MPGDNTGTQGSGRPNSATNGGGLEGKRRQFLKAAGAGAAAAGMSGCLTLIQEGGGDDPGPELDDESANKFEGETFTLGMLAPQRRITFGSSHYNAMELALEEINNGDWWIGTKGVRGAELDFKYKNTKLQARRTRQGHQELVKQNNAIATFGAAQIRSIMRPMADAEIIHQTTIPADTLPSQLVSKKVSPVGGDPEAEYEKYKYFFRTGPINNVDLSNNFEEYIKLNAEANGWERVAFLVENGVEEELFMENVPPRIEKHVEVPIAKVTSGSLTNWTPVYDEVEAENCDAAIQVVLLTSTASVNQWADQERPFALGGINIKAQVPGFWDDTAGKCEGNFTMTAVTPQTTNTPLTQKMIQEYGERWPDGPGQGAPNYSGMLLYDAVRQLAEAIHLTGANPAKSPQQIIDFYEGSHEAVRDQPGGTDFYNYVHGTVIPAHGFRGPDNRYAHDAIFDCMTECEGELRDNDPHGPTGVPIWQQWQTDDNGGPVMEGIAPKANASAEYEDPPWMR